MNTLKEIIVNNRDLSEVCGGKNTDNSKAAENSKLTGNNEDREVWEEIGISNDFLFGKVMKNKELCRELLQLLLPDLRIEYIEPPVLQKSVKEDAEARSIRFDVYVTGEQTAYDIEMQAVDTKELPKRSRYYQSMIDLQLIDKGESYKKLNQSYVIFICLTDLFHQGRHIYTFENRCKEDKNLALEDGTTKIFLNANGSLDDVSEGLKAFLDYVAGGKPEDAYVRRLDEAVKEARKNREWRHEYMTLLMRDQENLERGIEKGLEKGIEKGRKEGLEQGLEQGLERGLEQGIRCTILICRDLGMNNEAILKQLQEKFYLNRADAKRYMQKSY